jgi:hypothetical protein
MRTRIVRFQARCVTRVVIAGVATGTVSSRLRHHARDYSLNNVFPRLGKTGSTRDIINLLNARGA